MGTEYAGKVIGRERMIQHALQGMPGAPYVAAFLALQRPCVLQAEVVREIADIFPAGWRSIERACRLRGMQPGPHAENGAIIPSVDVLASLHRYEVLPLVQGRTDYALVNDGAFVAWARFMEKSSLHRALEGCGRSELLRCARLERRYARVGELVESYFYPNL